MLSSEISPNSNLLFFSMNVSCDHFNFVVDGTDLNS